MANKKPLTDRRTTQFPMRLNAGEKALVEQAAARSGYRTVARYMRETVIADATLKTSTTDKD